MGTSSEYVETKEKYDTAQITSQTSFVRAIDSENSWVAVFLWLAYDHHVVVEYAHSRNLVVVVVDLEG